MSVVRRRRPRSRWLPVALGGVVLVVVLLVAAQLALPRLAEREVEKRLGGADEVISVNVKAFPAIELLWQHADRVTARVRNLDAVDMDLSDLAETSKVGELDVRIDRVQATPQLVLGDVRVTKRDGVLRGSALVDPGQLAAILPDPFKLRLLPTDDDTVRLRGSFLGVGATAEVVAQDGKVVVRPSGLIGAFAAITLFSDPKIEVERVSARALPNGLFRLSGEARVR